MQAINIPGGLWWLARLLAYRRLKYAIEHELHVSELPADWPEDEGWG